MGPKEKIERLAQTPEDRVLLARVWERLSAGQRREIPAFSCFLSLREQELVQAEDVAQHQSYLPI